MIRSLQIWPLAINLLFVQSTRLTNTSNDKRSFSVLADFFFVCLFVFNTKMNFSEVKGGEGGL